MELSMTLLLAAALGLLGVVAGIYVSTLIHDHRIGDLSAEQYVAVHQMRDKTFRRVMPVVGLAILGLVTASAIFAVGPGTPRTLAAIAAVLLAADVVLTITRQLPLNARIQSWTEATIPAEWSQARDRWATQHRIRMVLGLAAYVCFLAGVLSTLIP
jgi:uncharacterized membrane protein